MNNFTSYACSHYNFFPEEKTQFAFNQKAKSLALSTTTFHKYMVTYNFMSKKPHFILPKIRMLPESTYLPINTMPPENMFFKYKLTKKKANLTHNKEDILDSLTSATQASTEYSSLRIYHQNKEPLMNNILSFLTAKLNLEDNATSRKEKTIKAKRSQIDLSIESLSLHFKKKGANDTHKIVFPLDIMPFFYAVNQDSFLFFLSKVVRMSADLTKIAIDFTEVKGMMSKFIKFVPLFKAESHLYRNSITKVSNWRYDWIFNDQIFEVTIELPIVQCTLYGTNSRQKIKFNKVIDHSYVIELLKSNFLQWDNSMLMYLSQYKDFRKHAKEINRPKLLFQPKQMATIALDSISNSSDSNQFYEFFLTSKEESFYIKLYSYQFEVNIAFNANESLTEVSIPTSLDDLYRLEKLKEYFDLSQLIKKCLVINRNNKTVSLNAEIYQSIDESALVKLEDQGCVSFKEDKMIVVTYPRFDWKIFGRPVSRENQDALNIIDNTSQLSPQLISDLSQKPKSEWSLSIQANQKSFETDLSLFCPKRRSSVSKARSFNKKSYSKSPTLQMRGLGRKRTKNKEIISLIVV